MSNHDNHRRGDEKRTEHGPRWEYGGSDNSAVARARKKWKRRLSRAERRTGHVSPDCPMYKTRERPSKDDEEGTG